MSIDKSLSLVVLFLVLSMSAAQAAPASDNLFELTEVTPQHGQLVASGSMSMTPEQREAAIANNGHGRFYNAVFHNKATDRVCGAHVWERNKKDTDSHKCGTSKMNSNTGTMAN